MPASNFIVTHGAKQRGSNPLMLLEDLQKITALRGLLPETPPAVICGTGRRHLDVAEALGLKPTNYTGVAGDPESLEIIEIGDGTGKREVVRLACGTLIPLAICSTPEDMSPAVIAKVVSCADQTVWCSGRPTMIALGLSNAKSATIYQVFYARDKLQAILEINGVDNPMVLQYP
ncbi:MAG: hypothetical protein AAB871_00075 [Patescibacteria group bacterium]